MNAGTTHTIYFWLGAMILALASFSNYGFASECKVVSRGDKGTIIQGTLLKPKQSCKGYLLISDRGMIQKVVCTEEMPNSSQFPSYQIIHCENTVVSPALINTHDHIKYGGYAPTIFESQRFNHRNEWRALGDPENDRDNEVRWAELRHLMAGTLTFADKGGRGNRLLRNSSDLDEGTDYRTFPLLPADAKFVPESKCGYENYGSLKFKKNKRLVAHVSEGVNQLAANEFECLIDKVPSGSTFVHMISAGAKAAQKMAQKDIGIVWSPRSNLSLYGFTAPVTLFNTMGIEVALASDWTISGSLNMFEEMKCADKYNDRFLSGHFEDRDLWWMTTGAAAKVLGLSWGVLQEGSLGDIVVLHSKSSDPNPYRSVINSYPEDVALVLKAGQVIYGDSALVKAMNDTCVEIPRPICGASKSVCSEELLQGTSIKALLNTFSTRYHDLYRCEGDHITQPTCTPVRTGQFNGKHRTADDKDGDGIDYSDDNCPQIFNPIRPIDKGVQADFDKDGRGDLCDPDPIGIPE